MVKIAPQKYENCSCVFFKEQSGPTHRIYVVFTVKYLHFTATLTPIKMWYWKHQKVQYSRHGWCPISTIKAVQNGCFNFVIQFLLFSQKYENCSYVFCEEQRRYTFFVSVWKDSKWPSKVKIAVKVLWCLVLTPQNVFLCSSNSPCVVFSLLHQVSIVSGWILYISICITYVQDGR